MTRIRALSDLHWPHLALLAAWPLVWWLSEGLPAQVVLFGWLVLNAVVLGIGERLRPFRREWHPTPAHLRRDGSVFAMNLLSDGVATALIAWAVVAFGGGRNQWPLAAQLAIALTLAEFGSYWMHRLAHAEGWWWRAHLLHHRPERMNLANAVTAHPLNTLWDKLARMLPLALLGFDDRATIAVAMFSIMQSLVSHANIAGHIGRLDYAIGSAVLHRLHHSTRERDAGNFGTALPLWDQIFGTYRRGPAPERVGVFEPWRYPGELALRALLLWPFVCARCVAPRGCCRA